MKENAKRWFDRVPWASLANGTARAYVEALRQLAGKKIVVPRDAELQAVGLAPRVGIKVAGYACFTVPPAVWQAVILTEDFHDKCLGDEIPKAASITKHLERRNLIRPLFRRVSREVADDTALAEPRFAPAWKAIDSYLQHLLGKDVLAHQGYGVMLEKHLAGLTKARDQLSALVRHRREQAEADAERKRYQEKITADAKQSLSAKHVDTFLNGRDDDLGRTTPLLYVRDDATYRKALGKLAEWQREFGGPFDHQHRKNHDREQTRPSSATCGW